MDWIHVVLVALVLSNLLALGSSRIGVCIRVVALQGWLLGALTVLVHAENPTARLALMAVASVVLKGAVIPWLLGRAVREADVRREVEPFVGYTLSLLIGLSALAGFRWLGARLAIVGEGASWLALPVAFFTVFVGLFLIITRRKAVSQVIGYLVMENGIGVFGVAMVGEVTMLVELGMLLDVFVAVFVMGIAIYHINREFDHIDADRLNTLKG
jgi:hydrogenase-4 component E